MFYDFVFYLPRLFLTKSSKQYFFHDASVGNIKASNSSNRMSAVESSP